MTAVKRETVGALKDPLWFGVGYRHHGGLHYDTPTQKVLDSKCAWCGKDATDHFHLGKTEIPLCIWHNNQAVSGTLRFIAHEGKVYGQVEQTSTEVTAWYRFVMDAPKPVLNPDEYTCTDCEKVFTQKWAGKGKKPTRCPVCKHAKELQRKKKYRDAHKNRTAICAFCKLPFDYRHKGKEKKTCSRECEIALLKRNFDTYDKTVKTKCVVCGKYFDSKVHLNGKHSAACSDACKKERHRRRSVQYYHLHKEEAAITATSQVATV